MLPPVLEIYVVWHPDDVNASVIANDIVEHFKGVSFSGIIGGGVHVSFRSTPWKEEGGAPQPLNTRYAPGPSNVQPAEYIAIIPVLGLKMAISAQHDDSPWRRYLDRIVQEYKQNSERTVVLPYLLDGAATDQTALGDIFGSFLRIGTGNPDENGETHESQMCRDLAQAIAQHILPQDFARLKVFISHTKRSTDLEGGDVAELVQLTRDTIAKTRLADFFDARDLQPGMDWDAELRKNAGSCALLALRTDLYSSREWCQREVSIAKQLGMPVVTLDAIGFREERGSFLMDHMPRLPARHIDGKWQVSDVAQALNLLTDECLKRAIWLRQRELSEGANFDVAWWAPHAPEPLTLMSWIEGLAEGGAELVTADTLRVLHPDPPLGPEERDVMDRLVELSTLEAKVEIMTPRLMAARGG